MALVLLRILVSTVFAVAGIAKLTRLERSRAAASDLGVPPRLAPVVGVALPVAELVVSLLLLVPATATVGAAGALSLLVCFSTLLAFNLARGNQPDCNCFGEIAAKPISWWTVARNGVLAAMTLWIVIAGPGRLPATVTGLQVAVVAGFLACGAAITVLAWTSLHLLQLHGRLLLRLDALESTGQAQQPPNLPGTRGLPVGAQAPEFELLGLHGETMTLAALRAAGRPVLLVFSDAGCGPCSALLPTLAQWQARHAAALRIVVVAAGSADDSRAKASEHGLVDVLLQGDAPVPDSYRARGTPSAVLVDIRGRIASPVVAGAPAINELVDSRIGRAASDGDRRLPQHQHGHAHQGHPAVGEPGPEVQLPTVGGGAVALREYRGRAVALLLWNPACGFCQQLLPDLVRWGEAPPPDAPDVLIISTGREVENRSLANVFTVALDATGAVKRAYGLSGTPMAVLVGPDGRVASTVAAGGPAVLHLLNHPAEVRT